MRRRSRTAPARGGGTGLGWSGLSRRGGRGGKCDDGGEHGDGGSYWCWHWRRCWMRRAWWLLTLRRARYRGSPGIWRTSTRSDWEGSRANVRSRYCATLMTLSRAGCMASRVGGSLFLFLFLGRGLLGSAGSRFSCDFAVMRGVLCMSLCGRPFWIVVVGFVEV